MFLALSVACARNGDTEGETRVVEAARSRFQDDVEVGRAWAQVVTRHGDWLEATSRWQVVLEQFPGARSTTDYARCAAAAWRAGDLERAGEIVAAGIAEFPSSQSLEKLAAEVSMAVRDWPRAVEHWQESLGSRPGRRVFPRRGLGGDWFESSWLDLVTHWDEFRDRLSIDPDPRLYRSIALTLQRCGLHETAVEILRRGVKEHPRNTMLSFDLAALTLEQHDGDPSSLAADLARATQGARAVQHECLAIAGRRGRRRKATGRRRVLDQLSLLERGLERRADVIRLIRVPRWSSIDLQLRAGRYLSRAVISGRVRDLSVRDSWPEATAATNILLERARRLADAYGRRFEQKPNLSAEAVSDATTYFMFHELCLYIPMARLAAEIAAEQDDRPVFIEYPTGPVRYLDNYTFSDFDLVYLFFELRRRGVNAFLVSTAADDDVGRALEFAPGLRSLAPRGHVQYEEPNGLREAVIPAGIRSIHRVVEAVDRPLVYSSGSVIKEFAYDRSMSQDFPIRPGASIHPPWTLLPTVSIGLSQVGELQGVQLASRALPRATASVEESQPVSQDWLQWLHHVLHPFLSEMANRCSEEVAVRGVQTVHICDHFFAEPSLYSDAVKRAGGRVVLWPHSANPVHIGLRRPASFDEVHAVTRDGVRQWRERFPGKQVKHSPELMLRRPTMDAPTDDSQPLHVVVIGGRSTYKDMPILDVRAHEESYGELFSGLETLNRTHGVQVRFKPRGLTGEHELWLHETVGSAANWRPVFEHPLRIKLPNMLFVSVSMGSSALLEGLGRGIPGLIVRDFPVRDYTTLSAEAFPILGMAEALELIDECTNASGRAALLAREIPHYEAEFREGV